MTITVTAEELEEFPEVKLPEVDFDIEQVQDLIDISVATREAQDLRPFNQAAGWKLQALAKELKEKVDEAAEQYKKECDEREAKILQARADKAKAEAEEKEPADAA